MQKKRQKQNKYRHTKVKRFANKNEIRKEESQSKTLWFLNEIKQWKIPERSLGESTHLKQNNGKR